MSTADGPPDPSSQPDADKGANNSSMVASVNIHFAPVIPVSNIATNKEATGPQKQPSRREKWWQWAITLIMLALTALTVPQFNDGVIRHMSRRPNTSSGTAPEIPTLSAKKPDSPPIEESKPGSVPPPPRHSPKPSQSAVQSGTSNQQSVQSGTNNQQTTTGPGGITQTMTGSPGGIQVGHDLNVFTQKPDRALNADDVQRAVELLKKAENAPEIYFITSPTDVRANSEINRFKGKLMKVFAYAGWFPIEEHDVHNGGFSSVEEGSSGPSQGQGIGCSQPRNPTSASQLAIKAFSVLHYPCQHLSYEQSRGGCSKLSFAFALCVVCFCGGKNRWRAIDGFSNLVDDDGTSLFRKL
jgi:hypothetical protein